jgi:tetratricopeptide (TPR) repeat protein
MAARGSVFRRLGFAHDRMFATFPPYRAAAYAAAPALLVAALGFWMMPGETIGKPVQPSNSGGAASSQQQPPANNQAPANTPATGDYATCGNADNGISTDAANAALAACQRIQNGTAQGSGSLSPAAVLDREGEVDQVLGNDAAGLDDLNQAITDDPTVDRFYLARAFIENGLDKYADAISDAARAITMTPSDYIALGQKAMAEASSGQPQAAISDADAALQLNSKFIFAQSVRGAAEAQQHDNADAIQDETTFLKAYPQDWYSLYWRGYAEAHVAGDEAAAQADLNASLQAWSSNPAPYEQLGLLAFRQQDWQAVITNENSALQINPNDVLALTAKSGAEIRLQQFQAAQTDAQAALRLNPAGVPLAAALKNLGVADIDLGDRADAIQALTQAQQIDPNDPSLNADLQTAQQMQ